MEVRELEEHELPPSGPVIQQWEMIPGRRVSVSVRAAPGETYLIEFDRLGKYWLDLKTRVLGMTPSNSPAVRELLLWSTPAALALTHRGDLGLHAAAIEVDGRALIMTAVSGSGKSTTAAAFHVAGHRVLSEDLTCVRVSGTRGPEVLPGPAVLRISEEARERLSLGSLKENYAQRSKLHLELPYSLRGSGKGVPLAGLAFLSVGEGSFTVERVDRAEAISRLWPLTFVLAGEEGRAMCFSRLADMVNSVPIWQVTRQLDWRALPSVVERIASELFS